MAQRYHSNATTNLHIRSAIQKNIKEISQKEIAEMYNVSEQTVSKWSNRECLEDKSSRPHTIHYSYTPLEEALIVSLRKSTWFSKEDIFDFFRDNDEVNVKTSTIYNILKKNNINKEPKEIKEKFKTFKQYVPGYLHLDVHYTPIIGGHKHYIFVAIDRATRTLFYWIYDRKTAENAEDFLSKCIDFFPIIITKILTDNGLEFSNRLIKSKKGECLAKPSLFDEKCIKYEIEHRLTKPRTPKTNGMVERVNHTIKQATYKITKFNNTQEMEASLIQFLIFYNINRRHSSLQKEIKIRTPFDALELWYKTNPELFNTSPLKFKNKLLKLHQIYSTTCIT